MFHFKSQNPESKYHKFHLSADIEKNPGPTPLSCKNNGII